MTFSQLMTVLNSTKMSPEDLAPTLGVGSMTVRRWQNEPPSKKVPLAYERTIVEGLYQLLLDGKITSNTEEVQNVLRETTSLSFQAIIRNLGVSSELFEFKGNLKENHQDKMSIVLSQIGVNEKHKTEVDESSAKLSKFKKLGSEWKQRISSLTLVIKSKKLSALDKWVAYGALFYLITPFDLIPDHIPVIGLLDDFGVLGFAVTYYLRKYPELFKTVS